MPNAQGKRRWKERSRVNGTNKAHENGEAMGLVGVRLTVMLGAEFGVLMPRFIVESELCQAAAPAHPNLKQLVGDLLGRLAQFLPDGRTSFRSCKPHN